MTSVDDNLVIALFFAITNLICGLLVSKLIKKLHQTIYPAACNSGWLKLVLFVNGFMSWLVVQALVPKEPHLMIFVAPLSSLMSGYVIMSLVYKFDPTEEIVCTRVHSKIFVISSLLASLAFAVAQQI